MHLAYTDEQEALKQELRAYFAELVTPEVAGRDQRRRERRPGLPRGGAPDSGATAGWASAGPRSTAAVASVRSSSSSS